MKRAAVGFRVHSGWTALVVLAVEEGAPLVLARDRVHLVETFTYEFRQPYHTAERMPLEKASRFVGRVRDEAQQLALSTIRKLMADMGDQGYRLTGCGVMTSSRKVVQNLAEIVKSHALIHSADGQLFRESILDAAKRCRLPSYIAVERNALANLALKLRIADPVLAQRVAALRRPLGPPWSQDEKLATIVAWLAII